MTGNGSFFDSSCARLGVQPDAIADFCRRWNIAEFGFFGSVVRDDFRDDSDVDVLITLRPDTSTSIRDQVRMEEELQALFGRKVDLVERRLLGNPYRRHNILSEHRLIYPEPRPSVLQIHDGVERFERDIGLLYDILRCARDIVEFTKGEAVDFYTSDRILRLAVERLLITIGEASRGLSSEFRAAHSDIPWSSIIAERNILVHDYDDVEHAKIWMIVNESVPELIRYLEPLLPPEPSTDY